jgi:tRNA(Ile)-lysidine synthase
VRRPSRLPILPVPAVPPVQSMLDRVRAFIRQHDLIRPDARVVAAVSGGSDSVALASILDELARAGELTLAGVAHLNHQLRPAADRDATFSASVAEALGCQILIESADVAARANRERHSIENAAHRARYEFFERARRHFGADVVALGHTRDDQAETVLLRLLRGAGPRGLAGMHPRNGTVVRPLLACSRAELRAYLEARRADGDEWAAWVEDESNGDVTIPRNRVRVELLPLLESRFNPNIVDVLADQGDLARELSELVAVLAETAESQVVRSDASTRSIDAAALVALPAAVARAVVWNAMNQLAEGTPVAFRHVAAVLDVARGTGPRAIDVPHQHVERIGNLVVLTKRVRRGDGNRAANLFLYPLSIPGKVHLRELQCVVSAEPGSVEVLGRRAITGNGPIAAVRGDLCGARLGVRTRRAGDRFQPVGLRGRKKLQDFFVDLKVARDRRDAVPIVVDENDRIVWIAGHRIDEAFRVTDPAQHVLLLRLRQA